MEGRSARERDASSVRCARSRSVFAAAPRRATVESASARARSRCSLSDGTRRTSSLLVPLCFHGELSVATTRTSSSSPGCSPRGASSSGAAPLHAGAAGEASDCTTSGISLPLARRRRVTRSTEATPWSSVAAARMGMLASASTTVSADGPRISTLGTESGMTSSWSGDGRSPIGPREPAANQRHSPLRSACRRPENEWPSGSSVTVSLSLNNPTFESAVDARPDIASAVPRGTGTDSPTGMVSGGRPRYDGYVARMATSPTKGRSVTRMTDVSLDTRPSVATITRSASSGPTTVSAEPPFTGSATLLHGLPVARRCSVMSRRSGALTVTRSFSPRITEAGTSTIASGARMSPVSAPTGCRMARHPSGARDVAAPSSMNDASAPAPAIAPRLRALPCSAGASGAPDAPSRAASAPAACAPRSPLSAASSAPRSEPARSERSRSMARATFASAAPYRESR